MTNWNPHQNQLPGDDQGNGWGNGWGDGCGDDGGLNGIQDGSFYLYSPTDARLSGGSGGSTGTGGSTATGTASASPFVINIQWGQGVSSAPAGFVTAVQNAVAFLEGKFQNAVTITINVGFGYIGTAKLGSGALGESSTNLVTVPYSTLVNELKANATTTADQNAVATLPGASPVTGGNYWESSAEARALGLISPSGSSPDGFVGFSSSQAFTYSGSTISGFDFNGVALHELTEVMGRMLLGGVTMGTTAHSLMPIDLFHYSAPGVRDFSASTPGYLSTDGGATNSGNFNTVASGDPGDWAASMGNDSFDAFANAGVQLPFTAADLTAMNVLGWEPTGSAPPPPAPPPPSTQPPTGVAFTPATASLGALQSTSGLASGRAIATVAEVGGVSGDGFTYSLGGAAAASFALSSSGNAGTLSTGSKSVAGATNGKLYALTVTANDTTGHVSSPASPVDVIVGSSGGDTVNVAQLAGSGAAAMPTFIDALGGGDRINGAGMTSNLWFVGGTGGDTLTGGGGANDFMYGGSSESTPSAMDIVTNFNVATDAIDFTGVGSSLSYVGQLGSGTTQLAAHTIGWMVSSGNTFVYADSGSAKQTLSSASMKIELQGTPLLTGANFLHH